MDAAYYHNSGYPTSICGQNFNYPQHFNNYHQDRNRMPHEGLFNEIFNNITNIAETFWSDHDLMKENLFQGSQYGFQNEASSYGKSANFHKTNKKNFLQKRPYPKLMDLKINTPTKFKNKPPQMLKKTAIDVNDELLEVASEKLDPLTKPAVEKVLPPKLIVDELSAVKTTGTSSLKTLDLTSALAELNYLQHRPEFLPVAERYLLPDLQQLYEKALSFSCGSRQNYCYMFYRDKTRGYYFDIRDNHDGVMQPYMKDLHGDPRSPINGRIKGLFFNVRVETDTLLPPLQSLFGNRRLLIPVDNLINSQTRLYFTDFYCNYRCHYVTLVLTQRGTQTDQFCQENLIEINFEENVFFKKEVSVFDDSINIITTQKPIVEILYTEDVDINLHLNIGASFVDVAMVGMRSGGANGIAKNKQCALCNLNVAEKISS